MQTVAVTGQARQSLGKKGTKAVRKEGAAPAVLYGSGDPVHFSVKPLDVRSLIYTPEFKLAELTVDGKTTKAIVKEVQFHPVTDEIIHIDFLALQDGHPIKVKVPVGFKGTSPGVRAGGKLQQAVRHIKLKTTPDKLVDRITMDISGLEMGDSIRIRDIEAEEGVEIINPGGQPVATVIVPRAMRSAATAAAKAADGAAEDDGEEATEE
ncbi:50S ribosomal protein L25 [Lewinellaceae bacterium SD302]|nr:50S ribosomal protein L25 [Lewinellaceae bacterium SD302]